jgi:hypothetical protein
MKRLVLTGMLVVGLGAGMALASAQGAGDRRGADPEAMRERMMDRMKTEMNATDEEWTVMQPLLEDVMAKQRSATAGRMGGMAAMWGQRGRPDAPAAGAARGGRPGAATVAGATEVEALGKALESPNTSAADLRRHLSQVRAAREKAEAELKASREALRPLLTLRQEASLVLMGYLD